MAYKRFVIAVFALSAVTTAGNAGATVMVRLDLKTLIARADRVIVGTVQATRSFRGARGRIYTEATLQVDEAVLGAKSKTITVRTLGGVVDGIGMRVTGAPTLRKGQRVLAFTELRGKQAARYIVGMRQGLYRVQLSTTGVSQVRRSLEGLSLAKVGKDGTLQKLPKTSSTNLDSVLPLSRFIETIRATAATCAKRSDRCLPARYRR